MNKFYQATQILNDKYIELDMLLNTFDNILGNLKTFYVINEGESGPEKQEIFTLDEDDIDELRNVYYNLERIVKGD